MSLGPLHVLKNGNTICSASVIFLHGSGDTGQGFLNWIKFLVGKDISIPHVNFYFPTAPLRPYTPLQGELSTVWFDRYNVSPDVPEHTETLENAGEEIVNLVGKVMEDDKVPINRIIIGGFSMGGALALHTAYRFLPGFAGVFTLSSFLNDNTVLYKEIKSSETPLCMFHGDKDTLVPISWGQKTYNKLSMLGVEGSFHTVPYAFHELKQKELKILFRWIEQTLPPLDTLS